MARDWTFLAGGCWCYVDCRACSLSGINHVHPGERCSEHPDAPGDWSHQERVADLPLVPTP